jgi:hypothetical protein
LQRLLGVGATWLDAACNDGEVEGDDQRVQHEHRPHSHPGDAEVLVHEEDDQPHPDDEALLQEEDMAVAELEQPSHERIAFGTPALQPDQREEGVEDVEDEDADQEEDIGSVEGIDVDVSTFARAAAAPTLSTAEQRIPDAGGSIPPIAVLAPFDGRPGVADGNVSAVLSVSETD